MMQGDQIKDERKTDKEIAMPCEVAMPGCSYVVEGQWLDTETGATADMRAELEDAWLSGLAGGQGANQ